MRRHFISSTCLSMVALLTFSILAGCAKSIAPEGKTGSSSSPPIAQDLADSKSTSSKETTGEGQQIMPSKLSKDADAALDRTATSEAQSQRPKRGSIYDTQASGRDLIAAAVRRAQRDHKQVLVEWGGNWCGWCHLLHDTFTKVPGVKEIVTEEFELVLIDSNTNQELLAEYGGKDRQFSYPHLTILDSNGKVLTNQNTEPLEEGKGHSPKAVSDFLRQWMLPKVDAIQFTSEQFNTAKEENKRVLCAWGTLIVAGARCSPNSCKTTNNCSPGTMSI